MVSLEKSIIEETPAEDDNFVLDQIMQFTQEDGRLDAIQDMCEPQETQNRLSLVIKNMRENHRATILGIEIPEDSARMN